MTPRFLPGAMWKDGDYEANGGRIGCPKWFGTATLPVQS